MTDPHLDDHSDDVDDFDMTPTKMDAGPDSLESRFSPEEKGDANGDV